MRAYRPLKHTGVNLREVRSKPLFASRYSPSFPLPSIISRLALCVREYTPQSDSEYSQRGRGKAFFCDFLYRSTPLRSTAVLPNPISPRCLARFKRIHIILTFKLSFVFAYRLSVRRQGLVSIC